MSKVSLKNETLPSFEPIEHKPASQKRKRVAPGTVTLSNTENQPAAKKSKAKKNSISSVSIPSSVVWIGATLQEEENKDDAASEITAAFSVYYGLSDSRNYTEKVTIKQNQNLDHVYIRGVICALENCKDDSSNLHINTGSELLQKAIEDTAEDDNNDICDQLKEKIAKRKGSTSIHFKAQSSTGEDELQLAHNLANEKLLEDNMMVDDEETLVNSLEVTETEVTITTTTVEKTTTIDEDNEEIEKSVVTSIEEETTTTSSAAEPIPSPSWATTLNLRNLLDILKAPFYRRK